MIQKDVILRLTEEIGRLVAAITGKNIPEALEYIDEAYDEWVALSSSDIGGIPAEKLLDLLVKEKGIAINRIELLAELLTKEGELFYKSEQFVKSKDRLEKALLLFDYVDKEQQIFSFEKMQTLQNIKKILADIS